MKLNYHPDTDSLYIDLSEQTSVESREISEGVVLDYDEGGNLVGIDIDNASAKVDLRKLIVSKLPGPDQRVVIGGPEECAEELTRLIQTVRFGRLVCRVQWMGMEQRRVLRTIELVAERVLPLVAREIA